MSDDAYKPICEDFEAIAQGLAQIKQCPTCSDTRQIWGMFNWEPCPTCRPKKDEPEPLTAFEAMALSNGWPDWRTGKVFWRCYGCYHQTVVTRVGQPEVCESCNGHWGKWSHDDE